MSAPRRRELGLDELLSGLQAGDRATLGRAITLIESRRPDHQALASELLARLMPLTGRAWRVGITGVPGVGKSTFIDALGTRLTRSGRRVAVLAVDPSSARTGGSILGDKTRMQRLGVDPMAFVRPSPAAGTLGGVAARTRETMLLCEAAGYEVVLVETVGVGQSETLVSEMTDFFLVLLLAGAGDELQGIKRGLMELADLLAVNKADGDNALAAQRAARSVTAALHVTRGAEAPRVLTCSAVEERGLDDIWAAVAEHRARALADGSLHARRRRQALRWMWDQIDEGLRQALRAHPAVQGRLAEVEARVQAGALSPTRAARDLVALFSESKG